MRDLREQAGPSSRPDSLDLEDEAESASATLTLQEDESLERDDQVRSHYSVKYIRELYA